MKYFINSCLLLVCYLFASASCGTPKNNFSGPNNPIITGAERHDFYLPLLKDKKVGIVTNQTGVVKYYPEFETPPKGIGCEEVAQIQRNIVDFLIYKKVNLQKIFAPEHGFRGTADAGEHIVDGKDTKTGLPIM
jgi:uncharacterized protein YbbC (DUF1343 family)